MQQIQRDHNVGIIISEWNSVVDQLISIETSNKETLWEVHVMISKMLYSIHPSHTTHVLSIACTNKEIKGNFVKFRDSLMRTLRENDVHELYDEKFRTPETLHISLVDLMLDWPEGRDYAQEAMEKYQKLVINPILRGKSLKIRISGVEMIGGVLYAQVESEKLHEIADGMANLLMREYPLVNRWTEKVKLRMKLSNNLFNAPQAILTHFNSFYFGTLEVREINLNDLGRRDKNGLFASRYVFKL